MNNKAFIDTTILVDGLLKSGTKKEEAISALRRFEITELPMYAIKEFKAGALKYFAWMHNKLVLHHSFSIALDALQRMAMTPKRYLTATAIEALSTAAKTNSLKTLEQLVKRYGNKATQDVMLADQYRLAIRYRINKAWRNRTKLTTSVVLPLPCYEEVAPFVLRDQFECEPTKCRDGENCYLSMEMKKEPEALRRLSSAIEGMPDSTEKKRRLKALEQLLKAPLKRVNDHTCRALGDAIFAFFAPQDAIILTTNTKDHIPIAGALGKRVEHP